MKYIVSQFTLNNGDQSDSDDREFDNFADARAFYNSIDVGDQFATELNCSIPGTCKDKAFAKSLCTEEDGEWETLDYEEYGWEDHVKDAWEGDDDEDR